MRKIKRKKENFMTQSWPTNERMSKLDLLLLSVRT